MTAACLKADTYMSLDFSVLFRKKKNGRMKAESNAQISIHIQLIAN